MPPFRCGTLYSAGMPRPVSNPPNPWETLHAEWLGEPPEAELRSLRGGSPVDHRREREPGRRLSLQRQPVPRMFSFVRLLLRTPDAPVSRLGRRHGLRSEDRREDQRAGAVATRALEALVAGRDDRLFGRHRLLPAARGGLRADAPLPRGLPRVSAIRSASSPRARSSGATPRSWRALAREADAVVYVSIPFADENARPRDRAERRPLRPSGSRRSPRSRRPASRPESRWRRSSPA